MAIKRHKPEEIVSKLRQVDVLVGQGMSRPDAIRQVSITEQTYYRWRKQYGGMGADQLKELKKLQIGAGLANDPVNRLPGADCSTSTRSGVSTGATVANQTPIPTASSSGSGSRSNGGCAYSSTGPGPHRR